MKATIQIEVEIDDQYVENWKKRFLDYHTTLYKSEEKAMQALKENPIEKTLADDIADYVTNVYGVIRCNTKIVEE